MRLRLPFTGIYSFLRFAQALSFCRQPAAALSPARLLQINFSCPFNFMLQVSLHSLPPEYLNPCQASNA
jgi:hypothetical protein